MPAGSLTLRVDHDGFRPYRSGEPLEVSAGEKSRGHAIRLERGQAATVAVVDSSDGRPVAGAEVRLELAERGEEAGIERSVTTGPDGQSRLRGLRPGEGTLTVTAEGFLPSGERPFSIDAVSSAEVVVAIDRGGTVSGRVLDPDGHPVPRAEVALKLLEGEEPEENAIRRLIDRLRVETDAWGRYRLAGIPPHPGYVLIASHRQFLAAWVAELSISAGGHIEGVDLRLVRGGTIGGRVLDERGAGIPGVTVEASWREPSGNETDSLTGTLVETGKSAREATTDARGSYEIHALLPGTYALGARVTGRVGPQEVVVEISAEEARDGVDIRFERGEVLRGRLLGSDREPLRRWWVCLEEPSIETWTDAEGRFELRGLEAGRIKGFVAPRKFYSGSWGIEARFHSTLPGGEAVLVLRRKATIAGRVVAPSERPLSGEISTTPLSIAPATPFTETTNGFDGGGFRLEVYPGRYRLEAWAYSGVPFQSEESDAGSYLPARPVEIEVLEGEVREGVELVFDDAGAIRGTVRRWGRPAARAWLRASSLRDPRAAGAGVEATASADGEGRFDFPRLPPGKYLLSVWTVSRGKGLGARREVAVARGEITELTLDLRSVLVRGRVTDSGVPLAAAKIEAVPLQGTGEVVSSVTDGAGGYVMELPGAGGYRFLVGVPGRPAVEAVIPEAGRELALDIDGP